MIILRQKEYSKKKPFINTLKKLGKKKLGPGAGFSHGASIPESCSIPRKYKLRVAEYSDTGEREPVSKEDLEKAKKYGVIQRKPNGKWGIIAIRKKLWWLADYDSKDSARKALAGYHMNKGK